MVPLRLVAFAGEERSLSPSPSSLSLSFFSPLDVRSLLLKWWIGGPELDMEVTFIFLFPYNTQS